MTISEFRAWFEGFTEGMEHRPNEVQWERIKEQIRKLGETYASGARAIGHDCSRNNALQHQLGQNAGQYGLGNQMTTLNGGLRNG